MFLVCFSLRVSVELWWHIFKSLKYQGLFQAQRFPNPGLLKLVKVSWSLTSLNKLNQQGRASVAPIRKTFKDVASRVPESDILALTALSFCWRILLRSFNCFQALTNPLIIGIRGSNHWLLWIHSDNTPEYIVTFYGQKYITISIKTLTV